MPSTRSLRNESSGLASISWWILFVFVRQVITFDLARGIRFIIITYCERFGGKKGILLITWQRPFDIGDRMVVNEVGEEPSLFWVTGLDRDGFDFVSDHCVSTVFVAVALCVKLNCRIFLTCFLI